MYTVVVCSNCQYVWIVQDRPKTSQCGKCRKRRKFKLLKKYHKTDDKAEAKLARAFYQSQVNDLGDHFDRAREKGVLKEDMDSFLTENEYLEMQGMDAEKVENAVENILTPFNRRSEVDIIRKAFSVLENPDFDDFLEYTREYDVSDENAIIKLDGLVRSGTISNTGQIQSSDIESKMEQFSEQQDQSQTAPAEMETEVPDEGGSQFETILAVVREHGDDSVSAILDDVAERGISRKKAVVNLEKLVMSGQVDPDISLQEISEARTTIIGEESEDVQTRDEKAASQEPEEPSEESEQEETANLSQREIMERAITDQNNPTEEEAVNYAVQYGISEKKAKTLLGKMKQHGDITVRPDHSLRLM